MLNIGSKRNKIEDVLLRFAAGAVQALGGSKIARAILQEFNPENPPGFCAL